MALPYPPQDHHIVLTDAAKLTKAYRDNPPGPKVKAVAFSRSIIDEMLAQNGCEGIRCYYALNDDGTPTLVITGVDNKGNDIYNGVLAEFGTLCPPWCDDAVTSNSPLAR